MKHLQKKQVKYALSFVGVSVFCYGLYKAYQYLNKRKQPSSIITNRGFGVVSEQQNQEALSFLSKSSQHTPFENILEDMARQKLKAFKVAHLQNIHEVQYKLILSLVKGNSYQGIVNITFLLDSIADTEEHFKINFNGGGIKYAMINGKALQQTQFQYKNHQILFSKEHFKFKAKNSIEIIFENMYSFLNYGLSSYFLVDEHQKYSLRQQVIYSINGYLDIQRIIPCINCLNQCKTHVEIIHPDTFQVFSNAAKSLERFCSVNEYPKYPFLFDITLSSLQKSVKINESSISGSSCIGESALSTFSSNYYNRKRANTIFYNEKLPSIHQMFIFSSNMVQLEPSLMNNPIESELLLRYFCKQTSSQYLSKNVNKIHNYILDVFRRLNSEKIKDYINKIDILIISERQVQGYFAPGVILLSQQSFKENNIDIRCYYLIVRGLLGLLQLEKGNNIVTIQNICRLNLLVFEKFQEFRNYLYIKNKKFKKIKDILNKKQNQACLKDYQGYFLKYYSKQLKFVIREQISNRATFQLNNLLLCFHQEKHQQFWENFMSNYKFLSPLIIEPLIKLALRQLQMPSKSNLVQQLKTTFYNSKYILNFYTNQQISDELPKFISVQAYGLEERMTRLKVKQKFKDNIIERYQKYLPIKSNTTQSESMYLQFKKFNENKNFHHISILKSEIKRVIYFTSNYLQHERIGVECSIVGWRLLSRLNLFPQNQQYYNLLRVLQGV